MLELWPHLILKDATSSVWMAAGHFTEFRGEHWARRGLLQTLTATQTKQPSGSQGLGAYFRRWGDPQAGSSRPAGPVAVFFPQLVP